MISTHGKPTAENAVPAVLSLAVKTALVMRLEAVRLVNGATTQFAQKTSQPHTGGLRAPSTEETDTMGRKVHGRAGGCLKVDGPPVWEAGITFCMKRDTKNLFLVTREPARVTCKQCRAKYLAKHPSWI